MTARSLTTLSVTPSGDRWGQSKIVAIGVDGKVSGDFTLTPYIETEQAFQAKIGYNMVLLIRTPPL